MTLHANAKGAGGKPSKTCGFQCLQAAGSAIKLFFCCRMRGFHRQNRPEIRLCPCEVAQAAPYAAPAPSKWPTLLGVRVKPAVGRLGETIAAPRWCGSHDKAARPGPSTALLVGVTAMLI